MNDYGGDQGDGSVDPGWGPTVRAFLPTFLSMFLLGGVGAFNRGRRTGDGLTALRSLFASLLAAPILMTIVLFFIADRVTPEEGWATPLSFGFSVASVSLPNLVFRRKPETGDESKFAAWYRTSFFLAFALCEAPYLFAFVLCFLVDGMLPVLIVLPGFLIGMHSMGPTRRNLVTLQNRVSSSGSTVDVIAALKHAPPLSGTKRS